MAQPGRPGWPRSQRVLLTEGRRRPSVACSALHLDAPARRRTLQAPNVYQERRAKPSRVVILLDLRREREHTIADRLIGLDVTVPSEDERGARFAVAVQQRHAGIVPERAGQAALGAAHPDAQLRVAIDLGASAQRQRWLALVVH